MSTPRNRRPSGTPQGGEFTPDTKAEAAGTDALVAEEQLPIQAGQQGWEAPTVQVTVPREAIEPVAMWLQNGAELDDTDRQLASKVSQAASGNSHDVELDLTEDEWGRVADEMQGRRDQVDQMLAQNGPGEPETLRLQANKERIGMAAGRIERAIDDIHPAAKINPDDLTADPDCDSAKQLAARREAFTRVLGHVQTVLPNRPMRVEVEAEPDHVTVHHVAGFDRYTVDPHGNVNHEQWRGSEKVSERNCGPAGRWIRQDGA